MGNARTEVRAITLPLRGTRDDAARQWVAHLAIAACALVVLLFLPVPKWTAVIAACVVALGVVSIAVEHLRSRRLPKSPRTFLTIDAERILRGRGESGRGETDGACVARWDEPFGVTVLANPPHSRALFAFTSRERTRFVAVRVETPADADAARDVFESAVAITDPDLDAALGASGEICLSGTSAATLLAEVRKRSPASVGRIYLFDPGGGAVALEGEELRVRDKVIDLTDALEWRSFTFHETAIGAITLYQATWARQGATELVFVCPIPAEHSSLGLGRSSDPPPAREHRVAVDRLFMIPLRSALERAPRLSRAGVPPRQGPRAIQT
jgi:hypothetical protein